MGKKLNKNAISSIVATGLLLMVAVLSILSFQSWYSTYQSGTLVNVEEESSTGGMSTYIEAVDNSKLYFNNGYLNLTIIDIKINSVTCGVNSSSYGKGLKEIDLGNCTQNLSSAVYDVIIVTNDGVFSKYLYLEGSTTNLVGSSPGTSCSSLDGGVWTLVPGSSYFGTSNFCVMKYEAKNVGGVSTSQEDLTPWVTDFTNARTFCTNLGAGYHLITNREWMTIARNIEGTPTSWSGGSVGSGKVRRGNVGVVEAGVSYDGANPDFGSGRDTTARLDFSNGEQIWDFSGNSYEYVDLMEDGSSYNLDVCSNGGTTFSFFGNDGYDECAYVGLFVKTGAADKRFEIGPLGNYNYNHGMGRIQFWFPSDDYLIRSGQYDDSFGGFDAGAGIYNVLVFPGNYGFRCAYTL